MWGVGFLIMECQEWDLGPGDQALDWGGRKETIVDERKREEKSGMLRRVEGRAGPFFVRFRFRWFW